MARIQTAQPASRLQVPLHYHVQQTWGTADMEQPCCLTDKREVIQS